MSPDAGSRIEVETSGRGVWPQAAGAVSRNDVQEGEQLSEPRRRCALLPDERCSTRR